MAHNDHVTGQSPMALDGALGTAPQSDLSTSGLPTPLLRRMQANAARIAEPCGICHVGRGRQCIGDAHDRTAYRESVSPFVARARAGTLPGKVLG